MAGIRVYSIFFLLLLVSCSNAGRPVEVPDSPEDTQLRPPVAPDYASLDLLSNRALARRLALDLTSTVRFSEIEDAIKSGGILAGVDVAAEHSGFKETLSRHVALAFDVDTPNFDDLLVMAGDDAALAAILDSRLLMDIAAEPALSVEFMLDSATPVFKNFFSGLASVMPPSGAAFWGLSGSPAWSGRDELAVNYGDGRPAIGILSTNSFIASSSLLDGKNSGTRTRAGLKLIEQIRCMNLHDASAHDFSELPPSIGSAEGVESLKSTNSACAGCHRPLAAAGNIFQGLGSTGGIENYRVYDPAAGGRWPDSWFGQPVSSWDGLTDALANDEAIQECLTRRVFESVSRRPAVHGRDTARMAAIPSRLQSSGTTVAEMDVVEWLRAIATSNATLSAPTVKASKVSRNEGLVPKLRWMDSEMILRVLAEAVPLAANDLDDLRRSSDAVVSELNYQGQIFERSSLPVSYLQSILQSIEQAASIIVASEFAPGVGQMDRGLFTGIENLTELDASTAVTELVRISVALSGQDVSAERVNRIRGIYELAVEQSAGVDAAAKAADGIAAGLTSILISPAFLAY